MLADYWAHAYYENPKLITDIVEDDEFDEADVEAFLKQSKPSDWEDVK